MSANNLSTNELLDRYVSGTITAPQEAELERRAEEDPVLAEALEGLFAFPEAEHANRVGDMLARTQAAVSNPFGVPGERQGAKIRSLSRYAAVASVLLLLAVTLFFLPPFSGSGAEDLAMKQDAPAPKADPTTEVVPTPEENATLESTTIATPEQAEAAPVAEQRMEELVSADQPDPAPAPSASPVDRSEPAAVSVSPPVEAAPAAPEPVAFIAEDEPPATTTPTAPVAPLVDERIEAERLARQAAEQAAEERRKRAADERKRMQMSKRQGNTISGRITNERGAPIIGALVRLPGLPIGERTDTNGVFQLDVDATASRIDISHPEYEEESFDLRNQGDDVQISLEDREEKKDYQSWTDSWAATKIPISTEPGYALPEEGYGALRKRIEDNRPDNVPLGKVKLSFTVNPDGTLEDFVFKGRPSQETMDYVGGIIAGTSIWEVRKGDKPVRVYFKVVFE